MSYGLIFESLKKNNLQNWLLYTKHDFLKQLSDNSLKKDCFLSMFDAFGGQHEAPNPPKT